MSLPDRVNIEQQTVNAPTDRTEGNVTVKVMLSLFDVPESATADFDKGRRVITLHFVYIGGDEPTVEKRGDGPMCLILGKNSQRLYGIRVALDEIPDFELGKRNYKLVINVVEEGVKRFQKANPQMKSRSFEAVNRVLKTHSEQFQPLVEHALING